MSEENNISDLLKKRENLVESIQEISRDLANINLILSQEERILKVHKSNTFSLELAQVDHSLIDLLAIEITTIDKDLISLLGSELSSIDKDLLELYKIEMPDLNRFETP